MTRIRTASLAAALLIPLLLLATWPFDALSAEAVEVAVDGGSIAPTGDRGTLDLIVESGVSVTTRLVGVSAEYDTPTGDTLGFESRDDLDLRLEPNAVSAHTVPVDTEYAEGVFVDWRNPYTIDLALGADIEALRQRAEASGQRPDRIAAALADVSALTQALREANERFPERLAALPDAGAWFDTDAVEALRDPLEQALCAALGRRVAGTGGNESRVEAYREATDQLGAFNLYPECMGREAGLAAGRALVATNRAQDALVLTERDDAGEVLDEWRDIYIAGRLALAELAIDGEVYRQFRPGIESLGEVRRLAPDHARLTDLANRLLAKAARHVDALVAEQREMDALQMTELMRQAFADHPQTERASIATATALLEFARRSIGTDNPIRANNAWVRGLNAFGGMPVWDEVGPQIQALRRDYVLGQARAALNDGRLDDAQEALDDAQQLAEVDPAVLGALVDQLLIARWERLSALVDEGNYEDAMARAEGLLAGAARPEVLGEARAALFLDIALSIDERYGLLAGIASRTRLGLAEEALQKGREADPALADSLATKFVIARWLFPGAIALVVVLVGLVVVLRGKWRKRAKARRRWSKGVTLAERGDVHSAAKQLEQAWTYLETESNAAALVGEESRGHMVLRFAAVQDERGRKDGVDDMRLEWKMLTELERPFDEDFDKALEQFKG